MSSRSSSARAFCAALRAAASSARESPSSSDACASASSSRGSRAEPPGTSRRSCAMVASAARPWPASLCTGRQRQPVVERPGVELVERAIDFDRARPLLPRHAQVGLDLQLLGARQVRGVLQGQLRLALCVGLLPQAAVGLRQRRVRQRKVGIGGGGRVQRVARAERIEAAQLFEALGVVPRRRRIGRQRRARLLEVDRRRRELSPSAAAQRPPGARHQIEQRRLGAALAVAGDRLAAGAVLQRDVEAQLAVAGRRGSCRPARSRHRAWRGRGEQLRAESAAVGELELAAAGG